MLFNFTLRPVRDVEPWQGPEGKQLGWFGLTDGEYWIEAGADRLFEYSGRLRAERGFPRFCDYQVVRLYEDVVEMLPGVLETVPADLIPCVSLSEGNGWIEAVETWLHAHRAELGEDGYWQAYETAHLWRSARRLDSGYLRPATRIQMWSDEETVHIEWDNRDETVDGVPAWTATVGAFVISKTEFMAEVHSFHDRLMAQMASRVAEVRAGALPPDVAVDLAGLEREHAYRASPIAWQLLARTVRTDWDALRALIAQVRKVG